MDKKSISQWNYHQLNSDEKKLYQVICEQLMTGNSQMVIEDRTDRYSVNDIKELLVKIVQDNPLLFHVSGHRFTYTRTDDSIRLQVFSIYDEKQYSHYKQQIISIVEKMVLQTQTCKSAFEIVKCFHDDLIRQIDYEYAYVDEQGRQERHTVVGALLRDSCVCDGFSNAMKLLCDVAGLACMTVKGRLIGEDADQELHVWNVILLEDKYYHMDITMDYLKSNGHISYDYFFKKDADMLYTHQWEQKNCPICD